MVKLLHISGLVNATGPILAGFFSRGGSTVEQPMVDNSEEIGKCPRGFYCPTGSENPTPCPLGTHG